MTTLLDTLSHLMADTFAAAGFAREGVAVVPAARPDLADFQCNSAMTQAKQAGKNPRDIAQAVADKLQNHPLLAEVSIAGPGFINLRLSDTALATHSQSMLTSDTLGCAKTATPQKLVVDYCGPNLAKALHVGHLRASVIGESICRILRFMGHEVIGDTHLGDWGMPMGLLITQLKRTRPDLPFFAEGKTDGFPTTSPLDIDELSAAYRAASALMKEDEAARREARLAVAKLQEGHPGYLALWRVFNELTVSTVKSIFARLNVTPTLWWGESDTRDILAPMVAELMQRKQAVKDQGAIVVPFDEALKMPPLILEKSDGGYTYGATDLATLKLRVEQLKADGCIYVVDQRQSQHFEQVFTAARQTGIVPDSFSLGHAPFGTVNGTDGKPLKTRSGEPFKLEDLVATAVAKARSVLPDESDDMSEAELDQLAHQIAIAAINFQELHNSPASNYIFDLENFLRFEGKTGPYMQYSIVRINSILAKARDAGITPGTIHITHPAERELALSLLAFPQAMARAAENLQPSILCDHAFTVAQKFSAFYSTCHILREADNTAQQSRLALVQLVRKQLGLCLELLGIDTPARMLTKEHGAVAA